ncbi:FAD-dependent monooxygenase [Microbispora sp. ATCC PTA-5024]|uniref:FAD-dependent monooxygenase n=1 Tax=Microbispora sp. ATCC PTA-5024 TaxID=316330 RepID=UPI0003DC46E7|nr:FAD-dependent monooxygenase [Microbispora sp. ATCC PTA-5024]ETK31601.1 monooxygenase [Microbispora sp. ATCC PTA-5024]
MARAVVIGGGIGGLTAAVALERRGWAVTVVEQAASVEPVGSGLAVAPNALRALDTIGLGDEIRKLAAIQGDAGIRRPSGRWLTRTSAEQATARYGDPTVLLLRSALVDLLAGALSPGALRLGTRVTAADPATGRVATDGGTLKADLVVAADGIRSATRSALFPGHPGPVYAGVTSWRIVVPMKGPVPASETWGPGLLFGVMPLANDRVYCYATAVVPPGGRAADERDELVRLFGRWHDPIPALLAAADPAAVLRHDIHSLDAPLPAFHRGRVALLGDAAHAMTPNLGQGACQAVEDAVVLARLVGPGLPADDLADRVAAGLAAYSAARTARTRPIVRRSRAIGRVTGWRNPAARAARDGMIVAVNRLLPDLMLRQFDDVFTWRG